MNYDYLLSSYVETLSLIITVTNYCMSFYDKTTLEILYNIVSICKFIYLFICVVRIVEILKIEIINKILSCIITFNDYVSKI